MVDSRIRQLARQIVQYSCDLQAGEKVLIEMHGDAKPLAIALIEEAYAVGAKPFIHTFDYKLERALLKGIEPDHMDEIHGYEMARMKDMDAYIGIRATENVNGWSDLSDEQARIYRKHYWGPLHLQQRCGHTKWCVLRYPNDAMAQLSHMSTEAFEDFYFKACLVDNRKMSYGMGQLGKLMAKTDRVRIVSPGTELTFSIKGIPSVILDGHNNVPDGEIYTAPVKDSVAGTIAFNVPLPFEGVVYSDVVLTFEKGKIIKATANHTDKFNQLLDTDEGARYIGEFAFGVNPNILHPITDVLFDEKICGSFHLTPGNCYDNANNGNKSALHLDFTLIQRPEYGGGQIYFDDVLIRQDGVFVLEELLCLNPENLI